MKELVKIIKWKDVSVEDQDQYHPLSCITMYECESLTVKKKKMICLKCGAGGELCGYPGLQKDKQMGLDQINPELSLEAKY